MRLLVAIVLAGAAIASGGSAATARPTAPAVDIYIRADVGERLPGRNAARVEIRWDFKCLGDRLGAGTYEWELKLLRREGSREVVIAITKGDTKRGNRRVVLPPGRYTPVANPFACVTGRGIGSTEPEIGAPFVVPDFCVWSVGRLRGRVTLDRRAAVKPIRPDDVVRAGDTIAVGRDSELRLDGARSESVLAFGTPSRVEVRDVGCPRSAAWTLALLSGTLSVRVTPAAAGRHGVVTANSTASATAGSWVVETKVVRGSPRSTVTVRTGRVTVRSTKGQVMARGGERVVVTGAGPPVKLPRRVSRPTRRP